MASWRVMGRQICSLGAQHEFLNHRVRKQFTSECSDPGQSVVIGFPVRFEVELRGEADDSALTRVGALAGEVLANPVIEEFVLRAE